jgi:2-polyprenyl-6-methoxyphenol hydroxylase-like FAD-dependent oxidoreductase
MRVAVAGGGPGGLFFATLMRRADPSAEVTVFERNRGDDTFGFGVVFSDRTLDGIHRADPVLRQALDSRGRHWDVIEIRLKGERVRCGGNGMAAIMRRTLLGLMQARARDAGAELHFSTEVGLDDLAGYDLVVAADGSGSRIRQQLEPQLGASVDTAMAKFIWFGTDYLFDGLTFVHERNLHGVFAVHGYPISANTSTFIVETDEQSWRRAGLDEFDVTQPPGASDMLSKVYLEKLFADQIDGHQLLVNNSRWANFRTLRTRRWHAMASRPVALLGDAVHTAHFSVGSGTKMAMEDAVALSQALASHPGDLEFALAAYQQAAQPAVQKIQDAARPSLAWWEHFGRYYDAFEPWQFAYHFLSRSITDARLARRAPDLVEASHRAWIDSHGSQPLQTPFAHAGWNSAGRIVEIRCGPDTTPAAITTRPGPGLLLADAAPAAGAWGARLQAPELEAGLPAVYSKLANLAQQGPALVAVYGGTALTRTLVCEEARLHARVPALLVDDALDADLAVTTVLSGRADLVGAPAGVLRAGRLLA